MNIFTDHLSLMIIAAILSLPMGLLIAFQVSLPRSRFLAMLGGLIGAAVVGFAIYWAVEVTKISGGQVTGPVTENWHIAQGSLKGTVYYNSYDSPMANGGAVLQIQPGAAQPTVLMGGGSGCVVCHSVSANGSIIVAGHQHVFDASGDLTKGNAQLANIPVSEGNHVLTFMGLYPDGSLGLTCGDCVDVSSTNGNVSPSRLMDPRTGLQIPAPA